MGVYEQYYRRYATCKEVWHIKAVEFKKRLCEAVRLRDDREAWKLTMKEYEHWMEDYFTNRRKAESKIQRNEKVLKGVSTCRRFLRLPSSIFWHISHLRKRDAQVQIVFITNMPQFAVGGYKVRAFGYLLKPVSYEEFALELRELIKTLAESKDASISLRAAGETLRLPISEICYVETYGRKLRVHSSSQIWDVSCTIGALEKELESHGFVRCHTAYLANSQQIRRISGNELIMAGGERLPISKHRRAKCIQQLSTNWGKGL